MPRFLGCGAYRGGSPKGVVRPESIVVACADGNFWLGSLRWKSWTATGASAVGTAHANDCKPFCAAGHFHAYPVIVQLARPKRCSGKLELTRLSWRYPGRRPAGTPATGSDTFRCA